MKKPPDDLIKRNTPKRPQVVKSSGGAKVVTKVGTDKDTGEAFALTPEERIGHTHVIGGTGSGKSKFLEYLIRQDLQNPNAGLCLIDPHGLLYDDLVHYISHTAPRLAKRVVLFNPAGDLDQVLGFNPIPSQVDDIQPVANQLTSSVLKALGQDAQAQTPRISRWLKNIFYPLVANRLTLLEALPFFTILDTARRQDILKTINNEQILSDWTEFERLQPKDRIQTIEGAANRLIHFLENRRIRHVIGQSTRAIDLKAIMDEGKILLVNLNGGVKIPHESTHLLGVLLVNELVRTAKLRDPGDRRLKPFHITIDEFGQYVTRDIARALEECRKNKVFLTLAHQHLEQLKKEDEYLYASVMTNCRNRFVFGGLSLADADGMSGEIVKELDLTQVKDEIVSTKARHEEETRTVLSKSIGHSNAQGAGGSSGNTETTTNSLSVSASETQSSSLSDSKGRGTSHTDSLSDTVTTGESRTDTSTSGTTDGVGDTVSEGRSAGTSRQHSETRGHTDTTNWSTTDTTTTQDSQSRSVGESRDRSRSRPMDGDSRGSRTKSKGRSVNETLSRSEGSSHAESHGGSASDSHSVTEGRGETESRSHAEARSKTHSSHTSTGQARQTSQSEAHSEGQADTTSETESRTQGTTEAHQTGHGIGLSQGHSRQLTASWNKTESETVTEGQATVPFLKAVEYKEVTGRTFWSKDELLYKLAETMKNQETGLAFARIGNKAPVRVEIDFVTTPFKNPRTAPQKVARFVDEVFAAHAGYYTPQAQVHQDYEARQRSLFSDGQPIAFDETTPLLTLEATEVSAEPDTIEDPFTV